MADSWIKKVKNKTKYLSEVGDKTNLKTASSRENSGGNLRR